MASRMIVLIPILIKILITLAIASLSLAIILKSSNATNHILESHIPLIILIASDYASALITFINLLIPIPFSRYIVVFSTLVDMLSSGTGIYFINKVLFTFNTVITSSDTQIHKLLLSLTSLFMVSLLIRFYQAFIIFAQYSILSNDQLQSLSDLPNNDRHQYFISPYPALHNYTHSSSTGQNSYDLEKKSARSASSETEVDKNLYRNNNNASNHTNSNSTAGDSYRTVNFKPSAQTLVASMAEKVPLEDLFHNYHNQNNSDNLHNSSSDNIMLPNGSNADLQVFSAYGYGGDFDNNTQQKKVLESPKLLPTFTTPIQKSVKILEDNPTDMIPNLASPSYEADISRKISRALNNETDCEMSSFVQTSPAKSKKSLITDLGIQKGQTAILKSPDETTFNGLESEGERTEIYGPYDDDNEQMILGDLKQIPEVLAENWPEEKSSNDHSTSLNLLASPIPKTENKLNHISLESWNKNSTIWAKNQIRMSGNHPNFYSRVTSSVQRETPTGLTNHLNLERPMLLRSFSEPSVVSTVDSVESPTPNPRVEFDQDFDTMSKMSILSRATDSNSKHDSLQSIVDKSFLTSYENISKLTMSNKPNLSAPVMGKNHSNSNLDGSMRTSSRSRTSTITSPVNLSPSSTVKHSRSHSNSPLKSLRSLKNLKSSLSLRLNKEENDSSNGTNNIFHNYSNSETDSDINEMFTSFEYHGVNQRSSPQQKYHTHTKTKSTISLKTPTRKNSFKNSAGLNKGSMTRFNRIELEPLSSIHKSKNSKKFTFKDGNEDLEYDDDPDVTNVEQFHHMNELKTIGTPDSNWSGDSKQSTCPSVVIGQYDREKWKRIKNKLLEESTSLET